MGRAFWPHIKRNLDRKSVSHERGGGKKVGHRRDKYDKVDLNKERTKKIN